LQAQEKRFALFRSYKQVAALAAGVKSKGEKAVSEATAAKELARNEAQSLINDAKTSRDEANALLATAPAGKGSKTDIDALRADLHGVDAALSAADQVLNEGRHLEAKTKASAAKATADNVKAQLQSAAEIHKAARTRS
jgi:hypothetical protein